MGFKEFICHIKRDKKNLAGKLRFIIPTKIGHSEIREDITEEQLRKVI